jgi:hypothetical protein
MARISYVLIRRKRLTESIPDCGQCTTPFASFGSQVRFLSCPPLPLSGSSHSSSSGTYTGGSQDLSSQVERRNSCKAQRMVDMEVHSKIKLKNNQCLAESTEGATPILSPGILTATPDGPRNHPDGPARP